MADHPPQASADAAIVVRRYLDAMETRDLATARALLGKDFRMTFPGGRVMTGLEELVAWSRERYRFVRKTYTGFETLAGAAHAVVYCFGTLAGAWPGGGSFSGVRFIDRFEVLEGRIIRQDVWNDLAEHAVETPGTPR